MNIDVGQTIAGKYELQKLLGKGAMGEVWLASHNSLGGEFAIKLVEPADDIEAETAAGRFQLEAQIAAKLSRKTRHIVSVSDHGEEDGLAYLVMELLEGESLEAKSKRIGSLSLPEVAAIVSQIARALGLAHEDGIFHRDLKPANVWLGRDEDGRLLVKLLDFGIARSMKPFRTRSPFATSKDMVLGTPSYMSPEQARGLPTLDYRCDLWALAVVAYEALTRMIPFEGDTVEDIFLSICTFRVVPILNRRPELPPEIEDFFQRAFAPKLEERFTSAAELTSYFESLVSAEDLEAALGIPLTPTSARRLEAARQSNPGFTGELTGRPRSNPNLANQVPGRPPSRPSFTNEVPGRPPSRPSFTNEAQQAGFPDPRRSNPSLTNEARMSRPDDAGVMVDDMAYSPSVVPPKRTGLFIALGALGLFLMLGLGVVAVLGGRKPTGTTATDSPPPPTTAGVASNAQASPTAAPPPISAEPVSIASAPPTNAGGGKPPPNAGVGKPNTSALRPVAAVTPAPPSSKPTNPSAPGPAPAPAPAKSVNKGDVF